MLYLRDLKSLFSCYLCPLFVTILLGLSIFKTRKPLSQLAVTHSVSAPSHFLSLYPWRKVAFRREVAI